MTNKVLAVVGLILLVVAGFAVRDRIDTSLSTARAEAQAARQITSAELVEVGKARAIADRERARADSADSLAAQHKLQVAQTKVEYRTLTVAAPDTCRPVIDAANAVIAQQDSVIDLQGSTITHLRVALDTTSRALDGLRVQTINLIHATARLENSTHPSFLTKLIPHLGVGLTAGVDAFGKPNAVAGITLGWQF